VLIVVFAALMVAAPLAMWFIAGGMNETVRAEVTARSKKLDELESLKKTQISVVDYVPGGVTISGAGIVNERLIRQLEQVTELRVKDADSIRALALEHNRKGHTLLLPALFPAPPFEQREILPSRFYDVLKSAYTALLADLDAGSPPGAAAVLDELTLARTQFTDQLLVKGEGDALAEEDRVKLTEKLSETRLAAYTRVAESIRFYAAEEALAIPVWDQKSPRGLAELFEWQWQYWINEDLLRAVQACNAGAPSVLTAPVKRIVSILPLAAATSSAVAGTTADDGGEGGTGMGFGMGPGGGRGRNLPGEDGGAASAAVQAAPLDPKAEATLNFEFSITGRQTNPLYDVRRVELTIIVESERLPAVMDCLSTYNFITITGFQLEQADSFAALEEGYLYGAQPVSRITFTIETIWLREWTAPLMPDDLKRMLGIPVATDQAAAG
jgi:hypothetical protein